MGASLHRFDDFLSGWSFNGLLPRIVAIHQLANVRLGDLPPRLDGFSGRLAKCAGDGGSGFLLASSGILTAIPISHIAADEFSFSIGLAVTGITQLAGSGEEFVVAVAIHCT